jgi:hypothetical protein
MEHIKNKLEVIKIALEIYWTKFEIWCLKKLMKLQNEINFTPEKYNKAEFN